MTKKDYIAIAAVLAEAKGSHPRSGEKTREQIAHGLVSIMARDNTSFDRDRFLIAAGVKR